MSAWGRIKFAFGSVVAVAMVALIYARAAKPIVDLANNEFSGFLTGTVNDLDYVIPLVLLALLLGILAWLFVSGVQKERTADVRRRVR